MWIYNTENKTIKQQDQHLPCVTGAKGVKKKPSMTLVSGSYPPTSSTVCHGRSPFVKRGKNDTHLKKKTWAMACIAMLKTKNRI